MGHDFAPGPRHDRVTTGRSLRLKSPAELMEPGRPPQRPKGGRMSRESRAMGSFIRLFSGILTMLVVVLVTTAGVALYLYNQYQRPGPLEEARTVAIPKGEGRIQIARRLEREGVISDRWSFLVSHLIKGMNEGRRSAELKAGEYAFQPGVNIKTVLERIASGRSVAYKLTIPEGLTSQQIVGRINAMTHLTGEITEIPAEGSLMPDTYQLAKGTPRIDVIKRMRKAQARFLDAEWDKRSADLPIQTKQEALILASIVEKETGVKGERGRVAAVFINRLRKNMRLQSDPTIIYGLVGGQGSLGRPIYKSEIKKKTPYNTYTIKGLPPTPIANPGRKAIHAVLNPAQTNDLYFVADGTGGHKFSETLKQHNSAVRQWRKIDQNRQWKKNNDSKDTDDKDPKVKRESAASKTTQEAAASVPVPGVDEGAETNSKDEASNTSDPARQPAQASAVASAIPLPVRKPKQR